MIIYTNRHPTKCAKDLSKEQWSSMISHYMRVMAGVHFVLDKKDIGIAGAYNENNPDVLWTRSSKQHYDWLFDNLCQLLVLDRKYNQIISAKEKEIQRNNDTSIVMSLIRPPHNLLNHGWSHPYSPDQKPYKGDPLVVWKKWLTSKWSGGNIHPQWPQGQPDWVVYDQELCVYVVKGDWCVSHKT